MGHGRSSATAKQGIRRSVTANVVGVTGYGAYLGSGKLRGAQKKAVQAYMGDGNDTKIIEAQLTGDTKSEHGRMAQEIENAAMGQGTTSTVYRGISLSEKQVNDMISGKKGFPNRKALNSWSTSSGTARDFALGSARRNVDKAIEQMESTGKAPKSVSNTPVIFRLAAGVSNAVNVDRSVGVPRMSVKNGKWSEVKYTEAEFIGSSRNKYKITGYDRASYQKYGAYVFDVSQI